MDSHKIVIKLFVEDASRLEAHEFVPIFHSWIQQRAVPDHLLIDVADYAHVHNGPGTCLITHEANFYTDRGEGRLGLMYARKQPFAGTFTDRVRQAFAATLEAAKRLEQSVKFRVVLIECPIRRQEPPSTTSRPQSTSSRRHARASMVPN